MHRGLSVCLSAAALVVLTGAAGALAQGTTTTTPATTTTTSPIVTPTTAATTSTTTAQRTTTTVRSGGGATTTVGNGGRPVPPPASGASQPLVPDLLGSPVSIATTSTLVPTAPSPLTTVATQSQRATQIASRKDSPSGATLILAAIAWLASLGGLFVYVEDQRSSKWRHLAR